MLKGDKIVVFAFAIAKFALFSHVGKHTSKGQRVYKRHNFLS
jgi:hypothetical protein